MKQSLLIAIDNLGEFAKHVYTQSDHGFDSFAWECDGVPFRIVIKESPYGFRVFMRGEFNWFDVTNLLCLETLERAASHIDFANA